jgi:hypothetical protein
VNEAEQIRLDHEKLRNLSRDLARFIAEPSAPDPVSFLYFRRELGQSLARHLKRAEWMVYPSLIAAGAGGDRETATRLRDDIAAFAAEFAAYNSRWTSNRITAEWRLYARETRAILTDLDRRIAIEEAELLPLLARREQGADAPAGHHFTLPRAASTRG